MKKIFHFSTLIVSLILVLLMTSCSGMSSTEVSCVTCVFTVKRLNAHIAAKESGQMTMQARQYAALQLLLR